MITIINGISKNAGKNENEEWTKGLGTIHRGFFSLNFPKSADRLKALLINKTTI